MSPLKIRNEPPWPNQIDAAFLLMHETPGGKLTLPRERTSAFIIPRNNEYGQGTRTNNFQSHT